MADPDPQSALRRKIAAHSRVPEPNARLVPMAERAFMRGIRHAAVPFDGLGLVVDGAKLTTGLDLAAAVAALPEGGLVGALEDDEGQRGLVGLSPGLVDALVEVQTTGRVEPNTLPPRPVTRIDEALTRDFLDFAFGAFAQESEGLEGRDWPLRMGYGSRVLDRRRINLLLPEAQYQAFHATISFDGVTREAELVIVLPTLGVTRPIGPAAKPRLADEAWLRAREAMLAEMPIDLEAVLLRVVKPLGEVERLAEGDIIAFDPSALQNLAVEDCHGHLVLTARLGQLAGKRALRAGPGSSALPQPSPRAMPAPEMALPDAAAPEMAMPALSPAEMEAAAPFDPDAPMDAPAPFDPDAPMGGFDPDAPMGGFDPDAPMGGFDPDAPMGGFDPDAPMPDPSIAAG